MSSIESDSHALETATLGGGCFWCIEAEFDDLKGVVYVVSGSNGGARTNLSYEQVCTGVTGHAEVVQVTFDPKQISYRDVLGVFFSVHDPTTLNRQGADVGTQYRSVIYYHSPDQQRIAEDFIRELSDENVFGNPIVTEVSEAEVFYPAEDYH